MQLGHQRIAILASGHQAILDNRGRPQLLDQEQSPDEQQQHNRDPRETRGLSSGCFILRLIVEPMVMSIHRTLPLGCGRSSALKSGLEARQGVAENGMFR
jgi:hypothetical protein